MDKDFPGSQELYDVLDEEGRVIGQATRWQVHSDASLIHKAVHVLVFRKNGSLLLQKRVQTKDIEPGKWDTSVGGHVDAGEDYQSAALREMKEELGIEGAEIVFLYDFKYRSSKESENIRTFRCDYDGPVHPHCFEIETVKDWTMEEVDRSIGQGIFTPNFEKDWLIYRSRFKPGGSGL